VNVDPGVFLALSLIVIFVLVFCFVVYFEKAIAPRDGLQLLAPAVGAAVVFAFASALHNGWIFALGVVAFGYFAMRIVRNVDRLLKR
jgi:membrane-bound acyltransferase YfiQ involved in biofilm formation